MTDPAAPLTALDMVRNLMRSVEHIARAADTDPVTAHVNHLGAKQAHAVQTAASLALVSIAEDIRRIADAVARGDTHGVDDGKETRDMNTPIDQPLPGLEPDPVPYPEPAPEDQDHLAAKWGDKEHGDEPAADVDSQP